MIYATLLGNRLASLFVEGPLAQLNSLASFGFEALRSYASEIKKSGLTIDGLLDDHSPL
jgi:hypothetical protein